MENKSFVELLENAFDAGRRHDRNELRELKEKDAAQMIDPREIYGGVTS